jgi:outer membrane murein-binding lipoprotein Lpp
MDLLLRLGLVDQEELQRYRRALRSSKKFALQSPQLRQKLADLLDKLIDLTTKDPATYSRVRYNVVNKEAFALLNKSEKSGIPVDVIYEVFTRGYEQNNDINEAFNRVNSFIAGGKAADMDSDLTEKVKPPTGGLKGACWKNYTAVGMKMKNGRKVPNCVPKEEVETEGYVVKYHDDKGKYKNTSRVFNDKSKAHAHAERGNKITRVGGKYTVHKINDKGHEVKEMNAAFEQQFSEASRLAISKAAAKKSAEKAGVKIPQPKKSEKENPFKLREQNMTTHKAVPLSQRIKRVKSFAAHEPKPIKYKYDEAYTGSEPVSGNRADPANRFVGTNSIRQNYASVTPGQGSVAGEIVTAKFAPEKVDYSSSMIKKTRTEVDQSKENLGQKHLADIKKALSGIRESVDLNESFSAGFELAPFARDYGMTIQSAFDHHPSVQEELEDEMNEAIYQGREVPLGKPMKGDVKKSKVYVRDPSTGNVKKVNFGDKNLSIKKDQPARKRSYCARSSGQGNLNKKTSANYWSRRAWNC